ncbi:nitroreductase family protein [Megalodesulfovibrio paquesii]
MIEFDRNPVLAALKQRRSIRAFTPEPVTREGVRIILEAGRWAPSGRNNQPWRFLVVMAEDPRKRALESCTQYEHLIRDCQVCICVFLEKSKKYSDLKDYQGAGACIQNMLLAAHALGLGAVWIGQIVNEPEPVFKALGLDGSTYELMAVVAVGRPDETPSSRRLPLEALCLEEL